MTVIVFGVLAVWIILFAAMAMIPLMTRDDRNQERLDRPIAMMGRKSPPGGAVSLQDRAA